MTYPQPLTVGPRAPTRSPVISLDGFQLQALSSLPVSGQLWEIVRGPDGFLYSWDGVAWVSVGGSDSSVGGQIANMPASTQILDSLVATSYRTVRWVVEVRKAPDILILEVVGSHNGIAASDMRPTSMQIGTNPVDISVAVTLVGSSLQLSVTPLSSGWTATWRRIYALRA